MKMKSLMTGIGVTMAVGSAACMVSSAMSEPSIKKAAKKKASKALKAMEDVLDDMQSLFK